MKRTPRSLGRWNRPIASLLLALILSAAVSAESPVVNPLRSPPRTEKAERVAAKPVAPAGEAVGTSVRQVERQPAGNPRAMADRPRPALPRERGSRAVVPAAYDQKISRRPTLMQPPFRGASETSVLHGTVTAEPHPGEIIHEGEIVEGEYLGAVGEFGEGAECGDCGGCGHCQECCLRLPCIPFDNLTAFAGVHGFTGPMNRGQTASFGFHEGFNWGAPVPCLGECLSMQAGARFTQNNFSGAEFSPDSRSQVFLTGGLFRRVDWGLQVGVAFDYLSDDWYTATDLYQLRPELSWVFPCGHELGFWFTTGMNEDSANSRIFAAPAVIVDVEEAWESTDLYAFFYRHRFSQWEGATARAYAGFTGASDGLIGADLHIPLGCDFALEAGFTYLVPEEDKGPVGAGNEQESWNVGITLVWYPCSGRAMSRSYSSPLFNVADNGSFMVDRVR